MGYKKQINKKVKSQRDDLHYDHDEENGNIINKKIFKNNSSSSNTTMKQTIDSNCKKDLSIKKQNEMMKNIERDNIQSHIIEQFKKFNPPICKTCKNRNADRICVNTNCRSDNYMQLICGKCHIDVHQKHPQKSEIDVEEYFTKLGTFLNNQQYDIKNEPQVIDVETLQGVLEHTSSLKQKLEILKLNIQAQIEESDKNIYETVSNCAIQALSNCEYDNVNSQLQSIKKCISFNGNKFQWNDVSQKFNYFSKSLNSLNDNISQIYNQIIKSYQQTGQLEFVKTKYQGQENFVTVIDNQQIIIQATDSLYPQVVSKYPLDKYLRYLLRVQISTDQSSYYPTIGLVRQEQQDTKHAYQENLCFYFKDYGMSHSIRGNNLFNAKPKEIEMYISISENKLIVSDYPYHSIINTLPDTNKNLQEFQNLVIAFSKGYVSEVVYQIQEFSIVGAEPDWCTNSQV